MDYIFFVCLQEGNFIVVVFYAQYITNVFDTEQRVFRSPTCSDIGVFESKSRCYLGVHHLIFITFRGLALNRFANRLDGFAAEFSSILLRQLEERSAK